MLNYQVNVSDILIELYNPIVGKHETEWTARRVTTPVQSMNAVEEFQSTMVELRDILLSELVSDFFLILSHLISKDSILII